MGIAEWFGSFFYRIAGFHLAALLIFGLLSSTSGWGFDESTVEPSDFSSLPDTLPATGVVPAGAGGGVITPPAAHRAGPGSAPLHLSAETLAGKKYNPLKLFCKLIPNGFGGCYLQTPDGKTLQYAGPGCNAAYPENCHLVSDKSGDSVDKNFEYMKRIAGSSDNSSAKPDPSPSGNTNSAPSSQAQNQNMNRSDIDFCKNNPNAMNTIVNGRQISCGQNGNFAVSNNFGDNSNSRATWSDGSYLGTDANGNPDYTHLKKNGNFKPLDSLTEEEKGKDPCAAAAKIDQNGDSESTFTSSMIPFTSNQKPSYRCNAAASLVAQSPAYDLAGQALGATATSTMGELAVIRSQQQNTQSGYLDAIAERQKGSADMQMLNGVSNLALAYMQYEKAKEHQKTAEQIRSDVSYDESKKPSDAAGASKILNSSTDGSRSSDGTSDGEHGFVTGKNSTVSGIVKNYVLNEKSIDGTLFKVNNSDPLAAKYGSQLRNLQVNDKMKLIGSDVKAIGAAAAQQHEDMAGTARGGALTSMKSFIEQMGAGMLNHQMASLTQAEANNLKKLNSYHGVLNPGMDNFPTAPAASAPQTITGNGLPTGAAATNGNVAQPSGLPEPFAPNGKDGQLVNAAPSPGAFQPGDAKGPQPGGGAPVGVGQGGTQAATGTQDDPKAQLAGGTINNSYDKGSAFTAAGGGGGGGDKGPDLSGLLAQFLPKKGDAEPTQGGIREYARGPASDMSAGLLDRSADIFKRCSDRTHARNRAGLVGI